MWLLAWRNLWRNKRRTLITAASVLFAVFFSILMRGFHLGTWQELIDSVLHSYTGYIQIQAKDYWVNKTLEYTLDTDDEKIKSLTCLKLPVRTFIPRLESFAMASYENKIKGVIIVGIDAEKEKNFTRWHEKIVEGHYFSNSDTGIIVSQRLAQYLNVKVNDSLVLLSQGYQGASASGLFRIIGIIKLPSPEFDNQMVLMPLPVVQEFYSAPHKITSWVVDIYKAQDMNKTAKQLSSLLPNSLYQVMSWHELLPELYQQYVSDEGGALIMLFILYIIVGFGIFGTVMMMLNERRYEMGIMIALGMNRFRLIKLVIYELLFICLLGILAGILFSIPVLYYYYLNPITFTGQMADVYRAFGMEPLMPVAWQADYIIQQVINVAMVALFVLIYPIVSLLRFKIVNAIRR